MKKRALIISVLVMLAVITSRFTYAFWANSVEGGSDNDKVGTVVIGNGGDVETTFQVTDPTNSTLLPLVPSGYEVETKTVDRVNLQFPVIWSLLDNGADGVISTLTISGFTFGGLTGVTYADLFKFEVYLGSVLPENNLPVTDNSTTTSITEGEAINIIIVIIFNDEPKNISVYNQVANGSLTLSVDFSVAAVNAIPVVPNPVVPNP